MCSPRHILDAFRRHVGRRAHAEILAILEQHSQDRGVSEEVASYWISAFSSNLHGEGRFDALPISNAMSLSFGTLAL